MRTAIAVLSLGLAFATSVASVGESQWTNRDYVNFYFRHYNGHVPLPHLRNEAQGALFNHLIDPGNITRIEQAPVSDGEKLRQLRIILAVLGACRAAYNVAVIVGEPLQQELTLVQVHTLEVAAAVAKLVRLSHADEGSSTAWATLVEGVIESVGDSKLYSSAQRTLMSGAITLHYPVIAAVLQEDERLRLDEALRLMKQALPAAP
ncbi:MAG: hypothetical protein Q8L53_06870 [Aestuariivirga sp.]|nr:hypothetical protein [Aestuariivirga sp.]